MSEQGENAEEDQPPNEEYPLTASGPEPAGHDAVWFPVKSDEPPEAEPPERFQFTLAELLMLTAAVALFMSILGLFPGGQDIEKLAGVAGSAVLLGMIVLAFMQPVRPIIQVAWWVMLGLYVLACVAAAISKG